MTHKTSNTFFCFRRIIDQFFFDFRYKGKRNERRALRKKTLIKKLIIDGFDEDQIWEEIQLQNKPLTEWLESQVETFLSDTQALNFGIEHNLLNSNQTDSTKKNSDKPNQDKSSEMFTETSHSSTENEKVVNEQKEEPSHSRSEGSQSKKKKKGRKKASEIDDKFFRLEDMEEFIRQAEMVKLPPIHLSFLISFHFISFSSISYFFFFSLNHLFIKIHSIILRRRVE
jgi:U3 small nucleolar RNA-associated protein MPP10